MFTLNERYSRIITGCFISAVLIAAFGAVYEHFSFGVFSFYMIYAFAFFLIGGTAFWMIMAKLGKEFSYAFICFWNAALATFTAGSLIHGVLDIYGTSNPLLNIFWIVGVLDIAAAFIAEVISLQDRKKRFPTGGCTSPTHYGNIVESPAGREVFKENVNDPVSVEQRIKF